MIKGDFYWFVTGNVHIRINSCHDEFTDDRWRLTEVTVIVFATITNRKAENESVNQSKSYICTSKHILEFVKKVGKGNFEEGATSS